MPLVSLLYVDGLLCKSEILKSSDVSCLVNQELELLDMKNCDVSSCDHEQNPNKLILISQFCMFEHVMNLHKNIGKFILTSELSEDFLLSCSHLHENINLILPYSLYVIVRLTITMLYLVRRYIYETIHKFNKSL